MRLSKFYLPLCFVFMLLLSCNKDKGPEPVVISSISPLTGPNSTVVTIVGSGFNTNATSNLVKFNGKEATVQSATATQLVVVVPKGAGTGPVSVQGVSGPEFKFEFTTVVSTLAGSGIIGFANGTGTSSSFNTPYGIAVDTLGNVYVADPFNHAIRKITSTGVVTTLAGNGTSGTANGTGSAASFYRPRGLTYAKDGNLYIADTGNSIIRKVTSTGQVTTFSGDGYYGLYNGSPTDASYGGPTGLVADANGNLFVADRGNEVIRKVTPAGYATTYAGIGFYGNTNGAAASARFNYPTGITFDRQGNLIIADEYNHSIRKISQDGFVTTIAGAFGGGFINGNVESAKFYYPSGVAVDQSDNIFVADTENNAIRKITPEGIVSTFAGSSQAGYKDGIGQTARFNRPQGIAIDKNGVIYVTDSYNHRIRKIVQE